MRPPGLHLHGKASQRGAVLMIMIVILVVGIVAVLIGALSLSALNSSRQEKTSAALAQAKEALIGRAVSDDNMPGSLPCPDQVTNIVGTNVPDDGIADLFAGNDCPSYIGRLPWKTLGLSDLRDGYGERLWYALSPAFRDNSSAWPLNSNTKGSLLVYNTDGTTLQTQAGYSAVAVIFSPGSPVASQTRGTTTLQLDPANYLDTASGRNNASLIGTANPGPFIAGAKSATFNDQLLYITTKELMPLVERLVARVVKKALDDYYAANGYYPWADDITTAGYHSDYGLNRGWLPDDASSNSGSWHPDPPGWPAGSPPQWFRDNQWYSQIYYSVAESYTSWPNDCPGCLSSTLWVDGNSGVKVLFFMPGTPIGTLTRATNNLSDYLEDAENKNDDDVYVSPSSQDSDRDHLYWLPGATWKP